MTITPGGSLWNGPYCPTCGGAYVQRGWTSTFVTHPYVPKHRKPGPAQ